ncbi:MAG TPA: trypsin-like peptidase domain-containing protein [Planctomycetaceae bacterium]|nr:trypsin-like peptidase domain-containing protein [Planctomycetaceae bacterium]
MPKRSLALALFLASVLAVGAGFGAGGVGGPAAAREENQRETPLVRAVQRARAAAVNIHTEKTAPVTDPAFATPGHHGRKINGMGTGIVIDERGYIVTNHHVVNGVDKLSVTLDTGNTYNAVVISEDPVRDVAILKIQASTPLTVMPLGTSSDLMLGETVFAIGNAFGYESTITVGIVSALHRDVEVNETQSYKNLIQTDAAINPGNSGGPLINLNGEVVGINVAIRAGAQKIGFAIPIDDARKIVADLLKIEYFDGTSHGVIARDVKAGSDRRMVIEAARSGSAADAAGLKPGDVVLKAGDTSVVDSADFERALLGHGVGDEVHLTVRRDGKQEDLSLKLGPANGELQANGTGSVIVHGESDPVSQRIWDVIGVRVNKIAKTNPKLVNSKYEGGLQVVEIRIDSPAAHGGIQPKDVLVGLDRWTTVRMEDVSWVLDHRQDLVTPLRFHIVRSSETLFGDMILATQTR